MSGLQHPSGAYNVIDTVNTGTITSVASVAADTELLAADKTRKKLSIYNSDANALCVALSDVTSDTATTFTVRIPSGSYFEFYGYTGVVKGIWEGNGVGYAVITSFK